MIARAMLLAAPLLVLSLAGCAESTEPTQSIKSAQEFALKAPTWGLGDWWTYDLPGLGQITWVVTDDQGSEWTLDINDPQMAFFHAAFGEVSTVGAISKRDLDGSQEQGPVHFFDFPLTENKTWSITWDDESWIARGHFHGDGTYRVTATSDSGAVRTYGYSPTTQWLTSMEAFDANGTLQFNSKFINSGKRYGGELVRWTVYDAASYHLDTGDAITERFRVSEDATDIWYSLTAWCDPNGTEGDKGAYELDITSQSSTFQNGIFYHELCPNAIHDTGTLEPDPGSWEVFGSSAGGTVDMTFIPRTEHRFRVE